MAAPFFGIAPSELRGFLSEHRETCAFTTIDLCFRLHCFPVEAAPVLKRLVETNMIRWVGENQYGVDEWELTQDGFFLAQWDNKLPPRKTPDHVAGRVAEIQAAIAGLPRDLFSRAIVSGSWMAGNEYSDIYLALECVAEPYSEAAHFSALHQLIRLLQKDATLTRLPYLYQGTPPSHLAHHQVIYDAAAGGAIKPEAREINDLAALSAADKTYQDTTRAIPLLEGQSGYRDLELEAARRTFTGGVPSDMEFLLTYHEERLLSLPLKGNCLFSRLARLRIPRPIDEQDEAVIDGREYFGRLFERLGWRRGSNWGRQGHEVRTLLTVDLLHQLQKGDAAIADFLEHAGGRGSLRPDAPQFYLGGALVLRDYLTRETEARKKQRAQPKPSYHHLVISDVVNFPKPTVVGMVRITDNTRYPLQKFADMYRWPHRWPDRAIISGDGHYVGHYLFCRDATDAEAAAFESVCSRFPKRPPALMFGPSPQAYRSKYETQPVDSIPPVLRDAPAGIGPKDAHPIYSRHSALLQDIESLPPELQMRVMDYFVDLTILPVEDFLRIRTQDPNSVINQVIGLERLRFSLNRFGWSAEVGNERALVRLSASHANPGMEIILEMDGAQYRQRIADDYPASLAAVIRPLQKMDYLLTETHMAQMAELMRNGGYPTHLHLLAEFVDNLLHGPSLFCSTSEFFYESNNFSTMQFDHVDFDALERQVAVAP